MPTTTARKTTRTTKKTAAAAPAPTTPITPIITFPAVSGIQAGREYYSAMIPLRLLKKLFVFNDEEIPAEMRSQRLLNPRRARAIADYILKERYVLNSLTATIDVPSEDMNAFNFKAIDGNLHLGELQIPVSARLLLADGQHRAEGLKQAVAENPDLGDETISVVLFLHTSLKQAQMMFHDLNNYTAKPSKSINLLYDHRSDGASITREVIKAVPVFRQYTDTERTSLGQKSLKLFTLNGVAEATDILTERLSGDTALKQAITYWSAIADLMPDWKAVLDKQILPGEVRQNLLSGHATTLVGLGFLGQRLLAKDNWQEELKAIDLSGADWSKTNPEWEGQLIFGGRIHKTRMTALWLAQYLFNRTLRTRDDLERCIEDWLKQRYHEDNINQILGDTSWEQEVEQEAMGELQGRYDPHEADTAWNIVASNYRMRQEYLAVKAQVQSPIRELDEAEVLKRGYF